MGYSWINWILICSIAVTIGYYRLWLSKVEFNLFFFVKKNKSTLFIILDKSVKIEFDFESRLTCYLLIWFVLTIFIIRLAWYRYGTNINQQLSKTSKRAFLIELSRRRIRAWLRVRDRVSAWFYHHWILQSRCSREIKSLVGYQFEMSACCNSFRKFAPDTLDWRSFFCF